MQQARSLDCCSASRTASFVATLAADSATAWYACVLKSTRHLFHDLQQLFDPFYRIIAPFPPWMLIDIMCRNFTDAENCLLSSKLPLRASL